MDLDKSLLPEFYNGVLDLSTFKLSHDERKELKKVVSKFLLDRALSQANTIWVNRSLLGLDYENRLVRR